MHDVHAVSQFYFISFDLAANIYMAAKAKASILLGQDLSR